MFDFVESDDGRLIGTLGLRELRPVLADIEAGKDILVAEDLAVAFGEPVRPEDTLDAVLARMHAEHVDILPVLAHGRLVGEVCLEDLLGAYRRETFKREMAVGMTDALAADHRSLRSLGDYVVAEVDTPPSFVGRSLADLDLRRREGITILVVKSSDPGSPPVVPTADHVLTPGAVLVVMGREKQVRAMRRHR